MKDSLTLLPTMPNELKAAIEKGMRDLADYSALMTLLAKQRRAEFEALKEAGFNEDQALRMICAKINGATSL